MNRMQNAYGLKDSDSARKYYYNNRYSGSKSQEDPEVEGLKT